MFGTYIHNFDPKGRLFVPSKLREELGSVFYVMIGRNYLLVFPERKWEQIMERMNAAPLTTADAKRHLLANVAKCEPDKQGRFVLPPFLREYAGLNGDIAFLGQGDHAEIWNAEAYKQDSENWRSNKENITNALEVLGI